MESTTSPESEKKEIIRKRRVKIDDKVFEVEIGRDVPQGFWGWSALSDEDISRIVNAVLRTLRKIPLVGHSKLYDYADRYIRGLFEKGEDVKDNLIDFINELIKDPEFSETIKNFNSKAGKNVDWIQGFMDNKWSGGLGSLVNMLDRIILGLRKLRLVTKVVVEVGSGREVYYVPADMPIEEVYEVLGLEGPKKSAKVDILERLVELAKRISKNPELGKQILLRWSHVIGKKEAEREAKRIQKRLYFGKRILIAMLNEIGIRANSQNYTKYVDPIEFNIRLKNEGLPIDPVALKMAMRKVGELPGKYVPQKLPKQTEPITPETQVERVKKVREPAPQVTTPQEVPTQIDLTQILQASGKRDPFAFMLQLGTMFMSVGQAGLQLTQKISTLEKTIQRLQETIERKVDLDTVKKYTENIERNIEALRTSIAKIVENMDQDRKWAEQGFESINREIAKLKNSLVTLSTDIEGTRKELEKLRKQIDDLPNQIQSTIQQAVTQTLMSIMDAIGKEVKKNIEELKQRNTITTLILTKLATKGEAPLEEILRVHPNKELIQQVLEELKNQKTIRITEKKGKKTVELVI